MKEATGELNMTVVIAAAIGFLSVFFFAILWPNVKDTMIANSKCSDAVCDYKTLSDGMVTCKYYKNGVQQGSDFNAFGKVN